MVCLLGILILPTLATVVLSFTDWQFGAPTLRWIGLDNYAHLAADRVFWKSLGNTVLYVAVVVPVSVGLGLGVALLIEAGTSGRAFYRAAYFLPVTATLIAMATVWEIMLHPSIGLINVIVDALGLPKQNWLKHPDWALFALAGIGIWQALGLNMVLLLAGLKSIPRDLYEAAAIDGADGPWTRFVTVTLPMLGPAPVLRPHHQRHPQLPGVRHRGGADRGRAEQGDRGPALHDVPGRLQLLPRRLRCCHHRGVPGLRAAADTGARRVSPRNGCTTRDRRPPSALRRVPPRRAGDRRGGHAGALHLAAVALGEARRRDLHHRPPAAAVEVGCRTRISPRRSTRCRCTATC